MTSERRTLPSKIAIRRWLLARMALGDLSVLDTCTGEGLVWSAMDAHVTIHQWVKCDRHARQPGTLHLDPFAAIVSLPLDSFNVIDIDAGGDPFAAYGALLPRLTRPTAVFLGYGWSRGRVVSRATLRTLGIPPEWDSPDRPLPLPPEMVASLVLGQTLAWADIAHAGMLPVSKARRQYALGLVPRPATAPPVRAIALAD